MSVNNNSFLPANPINMGMPSIGGLSGYRQRYVGQIWNGRPHGFGQMVELDSKGEEKVYTGQWCEGKRQGYGCERFLGSFYEGNWKDNRPEGWGRYTNSEGITSIKNRREGLGDGQTLVILLEGSMRLFYEKNNHSFLEVFLDRQGRYHQRMGSIFINELLDPNEVSLPIRSRPSVLLVQPLYHPNDAYINWQKEAAAISSIFSKSKIHDIAHPQTARDFLSLRAADVVLVRSHGSDEGIALSDLESLGSDRVKYLSAIAKTNAVVVFEGCRLGRLGGVAEALSLDRPDLYVVAAPEDTGYTAFVRKSKALQVRLYSATHQRTDRIYHRGKILQSHPLSSPDPLL